MEAVLDGQRARDLRRMKLVALSLLVAAGVVYIITTSVGAEGWVGYVRAFAEAAMVGALADWFAVTALFRHPLRIPIPHTAIIPNRKDQIGRSLGEFVEQNFLTEQLLSERLAAADIGTRLGRWLSDPEHAEQATSIAADALAGTLEVLDDEEVQAGLERIVRARVDDTPVAPLAGRALQLTLEGGHHERLIDAALAGVGRFLDDNRIMLRERLYEESPWWVPTALDNRVFDKIYSAVHRFIDDVATDPDHAVRHTAVARLHEVAERLQHDPELLAKGEQLKDDVLEHPDVRAWLETLWLEIKRAILEMADDPASELRFRTVRNYQRFGDRLLDEPQLRAKLDDWIQRAVAYLVEHYRSEVSELIESTVERWDGATTARRVELQVGRDLQFIRINGTIVGGLAGLTIHALTRFL